MRLAARLGQEAQRMNVGITGVVGGVLGSTLLRTHLHLHIPQSSNPIRFAAYGIKRLDVRTPSRSLEPGAAQLFGDLQLADPLFAEPQGVDLILGVDIYPRILYPGLVRRGNFVAQQTAFGWAITGGSSDVLRATTASHLTSTCSPVIPWQEALTRVLRRFWATEEVPRSVRQSATDMACEDLYVKRHRRDRTGRYVVPLPIIPGSLSSLGESLTSAHHSLSSLHRRMAHDPLLKTEYTRFMEEYLELGHMRLLRADELKVKSAFCNYLPHHGIWQRRDGGRKLRVVFNASCPTASGLSLNDVLHPGPKLQANLTTVMTRWRRWPVAYCADIRMMFRQVWIRDEDADLQSIVWSPTASERPRHYALRTVTYGETCAPYLALRTLKQLSLDEGAALPEATRAIERELYVDDFLCGADSEEEALVRRDQLIRLLRAGGFSLKKWVCNTPRLLEGIPLEDRLRPSWLQFASDGPVNELGILWDPVADCMKFHPPLLDATASVTKRLAEVARLFDPAGWLSPVVVVAKMFMQDLWREQLDWDSTVPSSKIQEWQAFRTNLRDIAAVQLPRWLQWTPSSCVQLHAFADASRRAIAATVYLRAQLRAEPARVTLVVAKTKLAPLRGLATRPTCRITIPRLELRAALLAARLLRFAADSLEIPIEMCRGWSDSNIVLHWLRSQQSVDNDFVDSYVCQINEIMPGCTWSHVRGSENPADIATRGSNPTQLASSQLWWSGPAWLRDSPAAWPTLADVPRVTLPTASLLTCLADPLASTDASDRFSDLDHLLRALARCRRLFRRRIDPNASAVFDPLSPEELEHEFLHAVRTIQQRRYAAEIKILEKGLTLPPRNPLSALHPILDDSKVLRVGGRLGHSALTFSERHPVIIDRRCRLADLLIDWAHNRALHGGFRVTYAYVMRRAWIVGGRVAVKAHVRRCVTCAKSNPRASSQLMAHLPTARVTPSRPFSRCGVDYAGPFNVLRSKGRGARSTKGYVAVFVCLCTKAVHLELVGDLSTAGFLAALSRFSGRRGTPAELWSDNATNFRGADAELRRMLREAEFCWKSVSNALSSEGVKWNFIPPSAPHFGGLWEAAVKSMKGHLRRTAGPRRLTYEEFTTLLVEIEMVLNSRPLGPVSGTIDDLDILTPAHFILGAPLAAHPRPSISNNDLNHATHWRLVSGLRDHFWARWSREYLNTLQQRWKWRCARTELAVGDVVMVIDPSLLGGCGRWPLGRVLEVYPGTDRHVRVVKIRTRDGNYTRPISKLVRLPVSTPDEACPPP